MKLPTLDSDIGAAERRIGQAKRQSRAHFAQVRLAIRARLARPSSLLVATGAGTLLGVWFARRNRTAPRAVPPGVSAWTPIVGVLSTLVLRYAVQRLSDAWARPDTPEAWHSVAENPVNTSD